MSPLERLRANPMPFAGFLGVRLVSAERDRIVAAMNVEAHHCTLGGMAHGGAIMALADTLGGAAAFLNLDEKAAGTTTIESKTNFVAGAPIGAELIATTTPLHRGRRTQVWHTRIETSQGKLVAFVTQTQLSL